jgi:hypothetical protein
LGSKLIENWEKLWTASQGFVMIHGKTDLKPFRKLSHCESDCNLESNQNEMNMFKNPLPQGVFEFGTLGPPHWPGLTEMCWIQLKYVTEILATFR